MTDRVKEEEAGEYETKKTQKRVRIMVCVRGREKSHFSRIDQNSSGEKEERGSIGFDEEDG